MNRLTLDHFYISLSKDQIDKIQQQLLEIGVAYETVKSGRDSWKGHYINSRVGEYFEILEDSRKGGFGLAFSVVNSNLIDTKKVIESAPLNEFKMGTRNTIDDQKWFDWYSLDDYLSQDTYFNVWIMDYYKRHVDYTALPRKKSVLTFDSIEMNVGEDIISRFQKTLELPVFHNVFKSNSMIKFDIYKKDGEFFNVQLNILKNGLFSPVKLSYSTIINNQLTKSILDF